MIACHLFYNINVVFDGFTPVHPYVTDIARLFPHQGQGSHYVVQVPDHRVHVHNGAGVIKVGTDGCKHIF